LSVLPFARHTAEQLPKPLLQAKTLVEQVTARIVEAAVRGVYLPGDRVVEAELARRFNVSRVPVREALRLLESQGIVVNMPYRGMRLMDVSMARLERILKVRLALENLAAEEVRVMLRKGEDRLSPLVLLADQMEQAAAESDSYALARLDTEFHRCLCILSGNDVLVRTWEPLALQLTIIFGLSAMQKDLAPIAAEHRDIIEALRSADRRALARLMETHIVDYTRALDHEGFVERLRRSASEARRRSG
jgi:DNA-binding GntR family transcriptional regulator